MTMTHMPRSAGRADNRSIFLLMILGLLLVGGVMLFFVWRMGAPQIQEVSLSAASLPEQNQPARTEPTCGSVHSCVRYPHPGTGSCFAAGLAG